MRRSQTGFALLLVMAAAVVTLITVTGLARFASTYRARLQTERSTALADAWSTQAEPAILDWLEHHAAAIVLPPTVAAPEVPVLHDAWELDGRPCELTITAWDQRGLVPAERAQRGSPLRLLVPSELLRIVDRSRLEDHDVPGLDLFLTPDGASPYPAATFTAATMFGTPAMLTRPPVIQHGSLALGALVATHAGENVAINVNTAPIPLVEQALRLASRGGLDQIIEAREEGKPAPVGGFTRRPDPSRVAPRLVTQSDLWAFRIDVRVGPLTRSWWSVYKEVSSEWECVQRLAISR